MTDEEGEEWRTIEGWEGYEVSNKGRVRCSRPIGYAKAPVEPRILKLRVGTNNYLNVLLGYKGKTAYIHRIVAEAFLPGRCDGLHVCHVNGDRFDNRAENLVWQTAKQNMQDRRKHGTHGKKLTEIDVEEIRRLFHEDKLTNKEIAYMFGITHGTVNKIIRKAIWADVL